MRFSWHLSVSLVMIQAKTVQGLWKGLLHGLTWLTASLQLLMTMSLTIAQSATLLEMLYRVMMLSVALGQCNSGAKLMC